MNEWTLAEETKRQMDGDASNKIHVDAQQMNMAQVRLPTILTYCYDHFFPLS